MEGNIISLDTTKKQGQVRQAINNRIFPFSFSVWDGEEDELAENLDVEFKVENKIVISMKVKISLEERDAIPVTRPASECIDEYFAREESILANYNEFIDNNPEIDFMRMRRFLFTAYNDLCDLDSTLENKDLRSVKSELSSLYRDYEEYIKKTQNTLMYSFERIFLVRQVAYTHLEQHIEDVKLGMARAKTECEPLGRRLEEEEKNLRFMQDKKSSEYLEFEKEVKVLRRRFVDLIDYIAKQKDIIALETKRMKTFREKHFQEFADAFSPMTEEIRSRFIKLLNTKGYNLDKEMWARAKTNQYVKKFFRDADIHGGYNLVTYLRYFLRGLDKKKLFSSKTKELFGLLKSLEATSKRNVMVVQDNDTKTFKSKLLIERVDHALSILVEHSASKALNELQSNAQDIIVLDYKMNEMTAYDFIKQYQQKSYYNSHTTFIVITPGQLSFDKMEEGKAIGIEYFVIANDAEAFSDTIRMAI